MTELSPIENPKFVIVLVQYVDKINTSALNNFIRGLVNKTLIKQGSDKLPKKAFNMRLAEEAVNLNVSGFEKNSVCPIGKTF